MITLLVPMMIDDYEIPYSFCRAFLSEIYFPLVYLQLHDRIKIHPGVLTDKQKIFFAVIGWKHSCILYLQHRQDQVTQADTFWYVKDMFKWFLCLSILKMYNMKSLTLAVYDIEHES